MKTSLDLTDLYAFFDGVIATTKTSPGLLERINTDIIMSEAGRYVYWPEGPRGYLDEYHLTLIAAILSQKNREWDKELDEYFEQQGNPNDTGSGQHGQ